MKFSEIIKKLQAELYILDKDRYESPILYVGHKEYIAIMSSASKMYINPESKKIMGVKFIRVVEDSYFRFHKY